jgi:hypothetical protein
MWPEGKPLPSEPTILVITKAGKFLRGHMIDHNVRIDSGGRVRGRIVMMIAGIKKDVDSNDISSLEKTSSPEK